MQETAPIFEYDAFISYRRTERAFAKLLEEALEAYTPPRGMGLPDRRLNIFRDESDLDGSNYYGAIDDHILRSRKLIVLCSPAARASSYVDKEIEAFVHLRGKDHAISILIDGIPNDEAGDDEEGRKAFPEALCRALGVPLASNYLGFVPSRNRPDRGGFEGAWYTVLANLLEVSRSLLEERERKRAQRRRRLVAGAVSGVMAALLALAAWALVERQEARRQSVISHAQQLAAQAQLVLGTSPPQLERSVLLGVQAVRSLAETGERRVEVARALHDSAGLLPPLQRRIPQQDAVDALTSSDEEGRITALVGKTLTHWDVASGIPLGRWTLDAPLLRGTALAAPFVAAADRLSLHVFDLETGKMLAKTPAEMAVAVALHPRARLVAAARTGSDRGGAIGDDTVRVWRIGEDSLDPFWTAKHQPGIDVLAFGPKGDTLAAASRRGVSIWRFTPEASELVVTLQGGSGLAFSPDGKRLAVADDAAVRIWEPFVDPPKMLRRIDQVGVRDLAFGPDGKQLVTSGRDHTARLWSVADGHELLRMPHAASVGAVQLSANGAQLITGSGAPLMDDGAIRVWELGETQERGGTAVQDASVLALADGTLQRASGPGSHWIQAEVVGADGPKPGLRVWGTADDHTLERIEHDGAIAAFDLSANGSVLATASGKHIRVFELSPFHERQSRDLDQDVHQLAVGPKGRWLLASTRSGANTRQDNVAWLWDLSKQADPLRLEHDRRVLAIAIADDGSRIATSWVEGATRLWSIDPLAREAELPLAKSVTALAFGPDSQELATGSSDRTARLWDVRTRRELARFDHLRGVMGVAFIGGGNSLVTASFAGPFQNLFDERPLMARIWSLTPEDAIADACHRLTRDLTDEERAFYSRGGALFDPTCPTATPKLPTVAVERR